MFSTQLNESIREVEIAECKSSNISCAVVSAMYMHRIAIKLTIVGALSALALLLCSTAFTTHSAVREAVASPQNLSRIPAGALLYPIGEGNRKECGPPIVRPLAALVLAHDKIWVELEIPADMTGYSHIPAAIHQWKIPREDGDYNWDEVERTLALVRGKLADIDSLSDSEGSLAQYQKIDIALEDEIKYGDMLAAMDLAVSSGFVDFDLSNIHLDSYHPNGFPLYNTHNSFFSFPLHNTEWFPGEL